VDPIDSDSNIDEWVAALVGLLREAGYRDVEASDIVRTALIELRHRLAVRQRLDIVRFFLERDPKSPVAPHDHHDLD